MKPRGPGQRHGSYENSAAYTEPDTHAPVSRRGHLRLQRRYESGHDRVKCLLRLHKLDYFTIVKSAVRAHADFPYSPWSFCERPLQERAENRARMRVARMTARFPTIARMTLKAQQRQVRWPAALLRVVADRRFLLLAVHGQDRRVQVEDQRAGVARQLQHQHLRAEPIVKADQSLQSRLT